MRYLRMFFVVLLAVILIGLAFANRGMVTVSLFPEQLAPYTGGTWSLRMPLFLLLLLTLAIGMALGLVWEWLRESHLRQESARRAHEVAKLEREIGGLRQTQVGPRDEVLAILDGPRPATPTAAARPVTTPATYKAGTTLPVSR